MPGIIDLPGWIWRRMPPVAKGGLALAFVALVAVALVIGPDIREAKRERERAERQEFLQAREVREARLRREQRPRFADGPAATSGVAARRRLVDTAGASVLADARRRAAAGRLRGPIRRVDCEPFPRTSTGIGAEDGVSQRYGRYSCIAVTAEFAETEATSGGLLGHPYRMRVDFDTGRYAFCKIAGRPAEGQLKRRLGVTVPPVCGGGP